jgi:5-methyltetrahydropteroyltriglutamate--homocysteine methyltransferase
VLDANVDQLLEVVARGGWDRKLGLGVVDVKSRRVEPPELIESRIRRAADVLGPDNLIVNPDCGPRHLPADIARAKLGGMVEASATVRAELLLDARASAAPVTVPAGPAADDESA